VEQAGERLWLNVDAITAIVESTPESVALNEMKKTMADMRAFGTSVEAYAVDNNIYPKGKNISDILPLLEPIYIRTLPRKDNWGNEFIYIVSEDLQSYWIISLGSDGKRDSGIYTAAGVPKDDSPESTNDPSADIVFSLGVFVRYPEGTQN
jgi:hypothetical protein